MAPVLRQPGLCREAGSHKPEEAGQAGRAHGARMADAAIGGVRGHHGVR